MHYFLGLSKHSVYQDVVPASTSVARLIYAKFCCLSLDKLWILVCVYGGFQFVCLFFSIG